MEQAEVTPHVYVLYTHRLFSGTSRRGSSDTPHVLYIYIIYVYVLYTQVIQWNKQKGK